MGNLCVSILLRVKTACIFVCFTAHDKKLNFIFLHFIPTKNHNFTTELAISMLVRKGWPKKANGKWSYKFILKRVLHWNFFRLTSLWPCVVKFRLNLLRKKAIFKWKIKHLLYGLTCTDEVQGILGNTIAKWTNHLVNITYHFDLILLVSFLFKLELLPKGNLFSVFKSSALRKTVRSQ